MIVERCARGCGRCARRGLLQQGLALGQGRGRGGFVVEMIRRVDEQAEQRRAVVGGEIIELGGRPGREAGPQGAGDGLFVARRQPRRRS